jgi:hypothetical protein
MFARSACSVLFNENSVGKRLAQGPGAWLRTLWASVFAASLCLFVSACGNDDNKPPETPTPTTTAEQINAAPPAPWAMPQTAAAQTAQTALPAQSIQTPPPPPAQAGAPASDSLVTPVIHTVD